MESKLGLAGLFGISSATEFLFDSWPRDPFAVHGMHDGLLPLSQLPFLDSLDSLLNSWPFPVQAHLPDVADESSSVSVSAMDARKLYSNQMSLLFNEAQRVSPVLREWIAAMQLDLGLPRSTHARCLIYATPHGKGTAAHFDQNINFVVQLRGTKKWKLAANTWAVNPTQRFTLGQPMDPELQSYVDGPAPASMPTEGQIEVILAPGSVLFVPQGYWHSTEAEGESIALNFTFNQPAWVDLLMLALRSRLTLSPEWRELADGVTSTNPEILQRAEKQFDRLLGSLIEDLPNWRAADILGATEGSVAPLS